MAEQLLQVSEEMADFVKWAYDKGREEITRMVNERLAELKEFSEKNNGHPDEDGFKWDPALEPNDGVDQFHHGGDCNKCRKIKFCGKKCRPNRLLKAITTPYLYQAYLEDHPEVAAKKVIGAIKPEDVAQMLEEESNVAQ